MIFQTEYWTYIYAFFDWIAESAGIMVVLSGILAITWLGYDTFRHKSFFSWSFIKFRKDEEGKTKIKIDIPKLLRVLSYLGLVLGILCIWSGVVSLILDIPPSFAYRDNTEDAANHFTCIYLIVIGIVMFLKPISDLPLSSIIGMICGTVTAVIIALIIPDSVVELIANWINPKWVIVIIFIIVSITVTLSVKFYVKAFVFVSKVLSWPPIALVIIIFSLIQGFSLWIFGISVPNLL